MTSTVSPPAASGTFGSKPKTYSESELGLIQAELESNDLLGRFFAEFLNEDEFAAFRPVERLFASLTEQRMTRSGQPLIRPSDCGRLTQALADFFDQSQPHFRTGDPRLTDRFEALIADFHEFCRKVYPTEAIGALILHAKVLLFMGRPDEALALVSPLALRPYAVIDNVGQCQELIGLFGQAHLMLGSLEKLPISFIAYGAWLVSLPKGPSIFSIGPAMAPFVCGRQGDSGFRASLVRLASMQYLRAVRDHRGIVSHAAQRLRLVALRFLLAVGYFLFKTNPTKRAPFGLRMDRSGGVLVTRAMGGIGDLLMMEPGLEALAFRIGRPVDFAIPNKLFSIFQNNPHVHLIDIDGPEIDVARYREFVNLSLCPAGRYESSRRPHVKLGRVEIFAKAMGISRHNLAKQGWHINQYISSVLDELADQFLADKGLGNRRVIGVQPYSRDSYKDYPHIDTAITVLAQSYDVLVFHHDSENLPKGEGIASTAGLPLEVSLALVKKIEAMVCVDSAFLHAAAAHDIPVVALFGPTDARTFTRHHHKVEIVWKQQEFGCVPCWRNEDLPCRITGLRAVSPCMAAIEVEHVCAAVNRALKVGA